MLQRVTELLEKILMSYSSPVCQEGCLVFHGISTIAGYLMLNPICIWHLLVTLVKNELELNCLHPVKWLVGWVLWHINLCRLFNAKSIFMKIELFQTI